MPDPLMYQEDAYVLLETHQPEQLLMPEELLTRLQALVTAHPEALSPDVRRYATAVEQAQYLMDSSCELDLGPDQYVQWYAVRLEK
jgi:hypothetical protein